MFFGIIALVGLMVLAEYLSYDNRLLGAQWARDVLPFGIATKPLWLAVLSGVCLAGCLYLLRDFRPVPRTFILYTPRSSGAAAAGPVYIKTGASAYAGFSSRALARRFALHWELTPSPLVIPLGDLGTKVPAETGPAAGVVRFTSLKTLEEYFRDPQAFTGEKHFFRLRPAAGAG
jgi:hypothetical protein